MTPPSLPGYRDLELVGSGGLGDVYRAVRESTGGVVAVKTVREHGDRAATERRVRRELDALLKLKGHPNVVQIEEIVSVSAGLVLVMEYVGGGTLLDLLESRGPLPSANVVIALADVARALADAHSLGVVHRDIKPHNVMIGQFGQCKVCDFGIAAIVKDSSYSDRTSALSYRYASPEELDDRADVGPATDVYSLGVTVRQLLTKETNEGRARVVADKRMSALPSRERDVWRRLMLLVEAMTAREPSRRPTASQVVGHVQALEQLLGANRVVSVLGLPVGVGDCEVDEDTAKTVRRPRGAAPAPLPPSAPGYSSPSTSSLPDPNATPQNWWEPA